MAAPLDDSSEYVAVETTFRVEVTLRAINQPFEASLIRENLRWFSDEPDPDISEYVVCEHKLTVPFLIFSPTSIGG